jgi:hypothetical protein
MHVLPKRWISYNKVGAADRRGLVRLSRAAAAACIAVGARTPREEGEELLDPPRAAFRTRHLLVIPLDEKLEGHVAFIAIVFEYRHFQAPLLVRSVRIMLLALLSVPDITGVTHSGRHTETGEHDAHEHEPAYNYENNTDQFVHSFPFDYVMILK